MIQFGAVNHDKDHVHILASIPPTKAVGKVVGIIKQNTSREIKQKMPVLEAGVLGDRFGMVRRILCLGREDR